MHMHRLTSTKEMLFSERKGLLVTKVKVGWSVVLYLSLFWSKIHHLCTELYHSFERNTLCTLFIKTQHSL